MSGLSFPGRGSQQVTEQLVLILDDEASQRDLLRLVVEEFVGARAIVAETGHQALVLARRLQPDLMLLDVRLPDLDGFEVASRLRADTATQAIPVIAVTALVSCQHQKTAFAVGCDDFVAKPFDVGDLGSLIRQHLLARPPAGLDAAGGAGGRAQPRDS